MRTCRTCYLPEWNSVGVHHDAYLSILGVRPEEQHIFSSWDGRGVERKLIIRDNGDDEVRVYVTTEGDRSEELLYTNHDEYGYDGMSLLVKAVKEIAKVFGIEVEER